MKVIVENLAIEYQDEGSGKTVLFLHGWQDNLHTFDPIIPVLSPRMRVVRLDLPGFGKSEMPREAWNLDNYVHFTSRFISTLGLDVDMIVGHSFGGRIAIKGIAEQIFAAKKIVLMGSAGVSKRRTFRNFLLKISAKLVGAFLSVPPFLFWREGVRKKIYRFIGSDYAFAGPLKETFLKVISEDISESARKIMIPTLLIWGSADRQTPLSDGEKLSAIIPHSELKVFAGAGHFVHREKPEEVAKLIQNFL